MLVAAALLAGVAAAFLATPRSLVLVLLVGWHATLIALPVVPIVLAAMLAGARDVVTLALIGLTGGALATFALFWAWWASPTAGIFASIASIATSAAAIAWLAPRLDRPTLGEAAPLANVALLWVAYALFVLAFGLAPTSLDNPLDAAQRRFGHNLPVDNMLPWAFAQQVAADRLTHPFSGDWLGSDRPPLQAAYFLAALGPLLPRTDVHYQVQASLLQALWVPGMWILLRGFALKRGALFMAMAATMFSGFALTHDLYTWPKLLPVAYLAIVVALVLNADRDALLDWRVALAAGACFGVAMLCHAGSAFVMLGLGAAVLMLRRMPPARFVVLAAAAAFIVMLPWMLYQKYIDPPGNRLAKWHLAGVVAIDSRSFTQALGDAYAALTPEEFASNKAANARTLLGPPGTAELVLKATTGRLDAREFVLLLDAQFLYMFPAMGILVLAPLAWLAPNAWRTREFAASIRLFAVAMCTLVIWAILIFAPGQTLIHHGSLAVLCLFFAAAMLALYAVSPWLALVGLGLHLATTLEVYGRSPRLAAGASLADYRAFSAIALAALVATCALLWKTSSTNPRSSIQP